MSVVFILLNVFVLRLLYTFMCCLIYLFFQFCVWAFIGIHTQIQYRCRPGRMNSFQINIQVKIFLYLPFIIEMDWCSLDSGMYFFSESWCLFWAKILIVFIIHTWHDFFRVECVWLKTCWLETKVRLKWIICK